MWHDVLIFIRLMSRLKLLIHKRFHSDTCAYAHVMYCTNFYFTPVHTDTRRPVKISSYASSYSSVRYRRNFCPAQVHMDPYKDVQIFTSHRSRLTRSILFKFHIPYAPVSMSLSVETFKLHVSIKKPPVLRKIDFTRVHVDPSDRLPKSILDVPFLTRNRTVKAPNCAHLCVDWLKRTKRNGSGVHYDTCQTVENCLCTPPIWHL